MSALHGKWMQSSADNYGAFLDALGVSAETKDVFLANKAALEIGCDGDTWCIKSTVLGKTREDKFKLGEEGEGMSIIGVPAKFTITLDGDALVEVNKTTDKTVNIRRSVEGGQLISKYTAGDVSATIKFDKA